MNHFLKLLYISGKTCLNGIFLRIQQHPQLGWNQQNISHLSGKITKILLLTKFFLKLLIFLLMSDPEFTALRSDPRSFEDHYESGFNLLTLKVLMLHTLTYLFKVKKHINENENITNSPPLSQDQLKDIQYEDSSVYIAQQLHRRIQQKKIQSDQKLTGKGIILIMISHLRGIICFSLLLYILELAFKLWFSANLMYLFTAVYEGKTNQAYIFTLVACIIWFFAQVFRHNAYYTIPIISCRLRAGIIMLLFSKVSRLTSFSAKASELGKITNLLSSDFNSIQAKLTFMFAGLMFPFGLIGGTVLIWIMVGWPAMFTFIVPLVILPISIKISKKIKQFIVLISGSKDKRIKLCSELIQGIRLIKLYGWEMAFKKKIQTLREEEIKNYSSLAVGRTFEKALSNSVSSLSGFFIFLLSSSIGTYHIHDLFSYIEVLTYLRFQLFYFISGISLYFQMEVIFDRIANILNQPQLKMLTNSHEQLSHPAQQLQIRQRQDNIKIEQPDSNKQMQISQQLMMASNKSNQNWKSKDIKDESIQKGQIIMQNFCGWFKLQKQGQPHLKNITFHILPRQFYGIIGRVGSGKSALLSALISEVPYYTGTAKINGNIAYVEQEPVILSGTVRQNILFQRQFNEVLYQRVVKEASLELDFVQFPKADQTIVGQKGITLSGGQKVRVALARALYAQADIYLLDDPLSAVDTKVAKQLIQICILPLTKRATVIMATHQVQFLHNCDKIIVMENGRIAKNVLPNAVLSDLQNKQIVNKAKEQTQKQKEEKNQKDSAKSIRQTAIAKKTETSVQVSLQTYKKYLYIADVNKYLVPITVILFFISEGVNTFYLRSLAEHQNMLEGTYFITSWSMYWFFLGMLQFAYLILLILRYLCLNLVILYSNQQIHQKMVNGIVRSPAKFFDITPPGQLTNVFSNDLGLLDMTLSFSFTDMIQGPIISIVMLINVFTIQIPFIPLGIFNIIFLVVFFIYSKKPIVECRQLYLKQRTPVFGIFGQMISSLSQIRIFGTRAQKLKKFAQTADLSSKTNISFQVISRGFGVYVSFASSLIMFAGFFIGVYKTSPADTGNFGVLIVLLTAMSDYLQYFLKQIITVQSIMLSCERAMKVINLPAEAPFTNQYDETIGIIDTKKEEAKQKQVVSSWPKTASFSFHNFSMRYRQQLPQVLKKLQLHIQNGQRVAIVGRTGAGKSSIIQAIFRLSQPQQGSQYLIGADNALKMGLHSLRKNIAVIPQTPFLFKGTIRENLDPFSQKKDQEIWVALEEAGLSDFVKNLPLSIQTDLSSGADIFSVGQKQLICLARALLKGSNILVLDEATSNVDNATDERIQQVIKNKFMGKTVITVAHRLTTIADYDKVVVMANGQIVQFGTPLQLIQSGGQFSEMVGQSGNSSTLIKRKAGMTVQQHD